MKRITYKKIGDNLFQSREEIKVADNKKVVVVLDDYQKSFIILDLKTNDVLVKDTATSYHKVRLKVKTALKTLGATFGVEKRYFSLPETTDEV